MSQKSRDSPAPLQYEWNFLTSTVCRRSSRTSVTCPITGSFLVRKPAPAVTNPNEPSTSSVLLSWLVGACGEGLRLAADRVDRVGA